MNNPSREEWGLVAFYCMTQKNGAEPLYYWTKSKASRLDVASNLKLPMENRQEKLLLFCYKRSITSTCTLKFTCIDTYASISFGTADSSCSPVGKASLRQIIVVQHQAEANNARAQLGILPLVLATFQSKK